MHNTSLVSRDRGKGSSRLKNVPTVKETEEFVDIPFKKPSRVVLSQFSSTISTNEPNPCDKTICQRLYVDVWKMKSAPELLRMERIHGKDHI